MHVQLRDDDRLGLPARMRLATLLPRVWLPGEESNLHQGIQSPLCYRYTTRHPVRIQSRQAALPGDSLIGEDGTLELPSHCAQEASP